VDSGSTDATIEIARQRQCDIYINPWPGFAAQRNWALKNTDVRTEWVLFVDADEVIPEALANEIQNAIRSEKSAFYLCFKVILFERWVKKSSNFPVWHPRLCRPGRVQFKKAVTGHGETWDVQGEVDYIPTPYIHYSFSKGLSSWLAKHNRLSSMECDAFFKAEFSLKKNIAALFAKDQHKKRQAIRQLSFRMPMRPFLRFLYSYVFKGGFLEGRSGFIYWLLYFTYELMIQVKMIEYRLLQKGRDH
jgi:glycosyltransferase involved in cell wall biosynthesis